MDIKNQASGSQERFLMMTETPVPRLITNMAIPPIISMLITSV